MQGMLDVSVLSKTKGIGNFNTCNFKEGWEVMTRGPRLLLRLGELTWGCLTNRQGCYTTNSAAGTTMKGAL